MAAALGGIIIFSAVTAVMGLMFWISTLDLFRKRELRDPPRWPGAVMAIIVLFSYLAALVVLFG